MFALPIQRGTLPVHRRVLPVGRRHISSPSRLRTRAKKPAPSCRKNYLRERPKKISMFHKKVTFLAFLACSAQSEGPFVVANDHVPVLQKFVFQFLSWEILAYSIIWDTFFYHDMFYLWDGCVSALSVPYLLTFFERWLNVVKHGVSITTPDMYLLMIRRGPMVY